MPVATVNGVNLFYEVAGEGPPLVLVHGFSNSTWTWEPVLEALAARFQVFAYDHRGHGRSDKPPGPYRIQTFADDLAGFLNFVGLDRVSLMGHSMGGRTALLFALQNGERLERLLLVGASGAAPQNEYLARFETLRRVALEEGIEAVYGHSLVAGFLPPAFKEGPGGEEFRRRFLQNTPEGYAAAVDAIVSMPDLTGRLGEIAAPTWACAGERDPGPKAFSALCAERIPRCARALIPACGHFPMQEATEAFLGALGEFLGPPPGE